MAKDTYTSEVPASSFLRVDEEEAGMVTNGEGPGPPIRRRVAGRDRLLSNGRDKLTMAEIKAQMAGYWKNGDTYTAIAEQVNADFGFEGTQRLSAGTIAYHVKSLLEENRKRSMLHVTERMALILARYDQIEMLVTEAYFASMSSDTTNFEHIVKQAKSKAREKQMIDDRTRERIRVAKVNKRRRLLGKKELAMPRESDMIYGDLEELLTTTAKSMKEVTRTETKPAGDPRWIAMLIDLNDKRAELWGLKRRVESNDPDQALAKLPDEERKSRMAAVLHTALVRRTQDKGNLAPASPLGGFKPEDVPEEIVPEEIIEEQPEVAVENPVEVTTEDDWEWD